MIALPFCLSLSSLCCSGNTEGFPGGASGKESACQCGKHKIPGLERSPGGGHDNPLQRSCLENPIVGAWWTTVHRVPESRTGLKRLSTQACFGTQVVLTEYTPFSLSLIFPIFYTSFFLISSSLHFSYFLIFFFFSISPALLCMPFFFPILKVTS